MQSKTFSTLCSMKHLTRAWEDVKAKKAGGGIDGESVASFEINLKDNLDRIRDELLQGAWEPYPYLRIEIPKKKTQKRQLGILTVKDKIVQQAIRLLFEPSTIIRRQARDIADFFLEGKRYLPYKAK